MKKLFLMIVLICAFIGCHKNDGRMERETDNIELRASILGFEDVNSYKSHVVQQCTAGNHENCCILTNGKHHACIYPEHLGIKHDGTHHKGSIHCKQQNSNGCAHNSCGDKNNVHHNGNHH